MQSYLGLFSIFLLLNNAAFAVIYDSVIQDAELVSQSEDMLSVDEQVMIVADLSNSQPVSQESEITESFSSRICTMYAKF